MLITHALQTHKNQKGQTPKHKINRIATTKNQLLNPSIKNIHKMNIINNKENQNPNIRKSPSPSQQKHHEQPYVSYPHQQQSRQTRIKSQYYQTGVNNVNPTAPKQSPIKKILFVKNLSYKSAKTSKNSSLDNKKQETNHESKYLSLGGGLTRDQSGKFNNQRRSYSHYNSTKSFADNQSEIFVEHRLSEKPIQEFTSKEMFGQNNQSQASYRMSPNELHAKMANKFNQNYVSQTQTQQLHKFNPQKLPTFEYPSSFNAQNFHNKSIKMCPNIESPDLSSLESFKNNKYLYQNKKQHGPNVNALIVMEKEKKQSLSSKKRTSRIKINNKNSQKHRQSFNDQNLTEQSDIMISSPSQPLFEQNNSKLSNGDPQTDTNSQNGIKSTNSKEVQEQSTLVQTKKFNDTFDNLNSQLSKGSQNQSIHCEIHQITLDNPIQKHSVKHYCANHPEKLAKFKVNKQVEKPYYCSKCTVLLVTHGFKVIQNLEEKNDRLQKLKSFIFQLEMLEPKLKSSQININFLKDKVTSIQSEGQKEIQAYYTALIKCLQTHKQTAIRSLNYHSLKVLEELDQLMKKLEQNEQQIVFLKNDILPNVDLIVDELRITPQNWKKIITEHEDKMVEIQRISDMISKVLNGQGDNKIIIKSAEIPQNELKSALNLLEQSQIVFKQKILKFQNSPNLQQNLNRLNTSPMNETKRSFSFDDQNIETSFYVPSSKKKLNEQMSPQGVENIYELTDSIRLSFGNRVESSNSGREGIKSPTFKAI